MYKKQDMSDSYDMDIGDDEGACIDFDFDQDLTPKLFINAMAAGFKENIKSNTEALEKSRITEDDSYLFKTGVSTIPLVSIVKQSVSFSRKA
jgi:hypothetical protein